MFLPLGVYSVLTKRDRSRIPQICLWLRNVQMYKSFIHIHSCSSSFIFPLSCVKWKVFLLKLDSLLLSCHQTFAPTVWSHSLDFGEVKIKEGRRKFFFFFFECLYFCVQNYNLTSASVPQRHMEVFLTQLLLTFIYIITSCDSIVSMGPYTKDSQGDPPNRSSPLCYEHKMKTMKHNITTITIDFRNTAHRPWSLQILCSHMLHI